MPFREGGHGVTNGRAYYALNGSEVRRPRDPSERPDLRNLEWHNDEVFRG